jgi:hypothetical protein
MGVGGHHHALAALLPRERPGTHCIGGWVDPRTGLDGRRKYRPQWDSSAGTSSPLQVAIPTALSWPTIGLKYNYQILNFTSLVLFAKICCLFPSSE